jgi:hypothetical protein
MKHQTLSIAALLALLLQLSLPTELRAAETDAEVTARQVALELAGAFSNAGFKIRDGHWSTEIRLEEPKLIEVNLYAGNQYWFSVGATDGARKLEVAVFDENGKRVESEQYADGSRAAAGFEPTASGPYFVRVSEIEGEPATFCLLYSYQ